MSSLAKYLPSNVHTFEQYTMYNNSFNKRNMQEAQV